MGQAGSVACCREAPETIGMNEVKSDFIEKGGGVPAAAGISQTPELAPAAETRTPAAAAAAATAAVQQPSSFTAPPPPQKDVPGSAAPPLMHHEMSYEDNSSYKGQVKDGTQRHGHGRWTSELGTYEGQWHEDEQHGTGIQTWADGRTFEGEFKKGKFCGKGRMEWRGPSGTKMSYEGQYEDDAKHGHGKFVWPDGRSYTGQWANGMRDGRAVYANSQGVERPGIWKDDKLVRWLEPGE